MEKEKERKWNLNLHFIMKVIYLSYHLIKHSMFNFNKSVGETVRIAIKKVEIDFSPVNYSTYTIIKKISFGNKFKYTIKNENSTRVVQSYS